MMGIVPNEMFKKQKRSFRKRVYYRKLFLLFVNNFLNHTAFQFTEFRKRK